MYTFAVNKGSHNLKVTDFADDNKQYGVIYPNEVCLMYDGEQFYLTKFLASDGKIKDGSLHTNEYITDIKYLGEHPYSREVIDGQEYLIYKMRRTMNVYRADASYWGKVAAGMFVATKSCVAGESHRDWMEINYVKSTAGKWVKVEGAGVQHGFVDTGLSIASGYNSIPLYGNW